jgi:hypothetical protein
MSSIAWVLGLERRTAQVHVQALIANGHLERLETAGKPNTWRLISRDFEWPVWADDAAEGASPDDAGGASPDDAPQAEAPASQSAQTRVTRGHPPASPHDTGGASPGDAQSAFSSAKHQPYISSAHAREAVVAKAFPKGKGRTGTQLRRIERALQARIGGAGERKGEVLAALRLWWERDVASIGGAPVATATNNRAEIEIRAYFLRQRSSAGVDWPTLRPAVHALVKAMVAHDAAPPDGVVQLLPQPQKAPAPPPAEPHAGHSAEERRRSELLATERKAKPSRLILDEFAEMFRNVLPTIAWFQWLDGAVQQHGVECVRGVHQRFAAGLSTVVAAGEIINRDDAAENFARLQQILAATAAEASGAEAGQ